ncbi:MAG: ferritin-like domain-containing protein [Proteobacteria bacterium]|nr:ferritin-like domain-containing protein [Pseudomonadota bacterium]
MSAVPTTAPPEAELETILVSFDTAYAWNYRGVREGLLELYEKAKRDQWNASERLDWSIHVEPESEILPAAFSPMAGYEPYERLRGKDLERFRHAMISLTLSQFLHGEQGAMIVASQLVGAAPSIDAKYFASTQTMDEARHVEVFSRYLNEKLDWEWPINRELKELLDATIQDSRWDMKYIGMQIVIEGLAMAAFGSMYQVCQEPLLKELVLNVMRDESRHVAFGVHSLKGYFDDMPESERRDREDFLIYACELSKNRMVSYEIADAMGWDREEVRRAQLESPIGMKVRAALFMRIVPNLKRLGFLTPRVRDAFEKLEILHFEDMDPEFQEKQLGLL